MQFFKSTILFALAFATFAAAAPTEESVEGHPPHCGTLLASCDVNSKCCSDLCLLGVSAPNYRT